AAGKVVRSYSSAAPAAGAGRGGRGGFGRGPAARLDASAGMHRFTWDLRYAAQGEQGPMAVPGHYQVRLTDGAWTATQPLTVKEDPRITSDGVSTAMLQQQFEHNQRVLALVERVNALVARVRRAQRTPPAGASPERIAALAAKLITPAIRYSQPELQTQITYLYSMTNSADQQIGRDAIERYATLKRQLDQAESE